MRGRYAVLTLTVGCIFSTWEPPSMKIERKSIAVQSDKVDTAFAECPWMPAGNNQPVARSKVGKVTTFWILCVCSWSVFETWAEIGTATDNLRLCAILIAKLIWLLVGRAAIYDSRAGRTIFAFLCGVSVLAVASALPSVYVISKTIFILLLVECLLKTSCLIALGGKCSKG